MKLIMTNKESNKENDSEKLYNPFFWIREFILFLEEFPENLIGIMNKMIITNCNNYK